MPQTKIYLGTPWFNDVQKKRVEEATEALQNNPTVGVVHFPFDTQYKDAAVGDDKNGLFGTFEWQVATNLNDTTYLGTADLGVFLYDLDHVDDGSAVEIGMLRAMNKPVIIVLLSEHPEEVKVNLMIAQGGTSFLSSIKELETFNFNHPASEPKVPEQYQVF